VWQLGTRDIVDASIDRASAKPLSRSLHVAFAWHF
jgi:hypothetical protein